MSRIQPKRRCRLQFEQLEDRVVPSTVNLTTSGAIGMVNQAIFQQAAQQPTGSGVIQSFVRLQAQGAKATVEQGLNTDGPLVFDENKSRVFTHSLQLGSIPEIDIGGVKYREFLLDINQKMSQPFLSLDELRLFVANAGNMGYNPSTQTLTGGQAPIYDLDAGGDNMIKLDARLHPGSGVGDMYLYIPSNLFGTDPSAYVYLYSKFGVNFTANAGFEEWAVPSSAIGATNNSISGTVLVNGVPQPDVTLFLDANNNGILDNNEVYTTTDANGHYTFTNLDSGLGTLTTYTIREIAPVGETELSQTATSITLDQTSSMAATVDFYNALNQQIGISGTVLMSDGTIATGQSVALLDASGNLIETTTTDSNGTFAFKDLTAGSYEVQVTNPLNGSINTMSVQVTSTGGIQTVNFVLSSGSGVIGA